MVQPFSFLAQPFFGLCRATFHGESRGESRQIRLLDRFAEIPHDGPLADLMWSLGVVDGTGLGKWFIHIYDYTMTMIDII